jgi:hypothetical protein
MKGAKRPLQLRRTDHTRNTRAAAALAERSAFLSDEPAFATAFAQATSCQEDYSEGLREQRRGRLSAGSLGCGNDLVEALITAQRIPARIELEIAERRR